jgi:hypothetical protein
VNDLTKIERRIEDNSKQLETLSIKSAESVVQNWDLQRKTLEQINRVQANIDEEIEVEKVL